MMPLDPFCCVKGGYDAANCLAYAGHRMVRRVLLGS